MSVQFKRIRVKHYISAYVVINIVYYDIRKLPEISTSNEDVSHVAYTMH